MNYRKVSATVIHDGKQIFNITVHTKEHDNIEIFGGTCTTTPWKMDTYTYTQVREKIIRFLIGAMCKPIIIKEDNDTITYAINMINVNRPFEINRLTLEKGC